MDCISIALSFHVTLRQRFNFVLKFLPISIHCVAPEVAVAKWESNHASSLLKKISSYGIWLLLALQDQFLHLFFRFWKQDCWHLQKLDAEIKLLEYIPASYWSHCESNRESYMYCILLYTCLPELSFTSRSSLHVKNGNLHQATWSVPVWFPCRRRSAVSGRDGGLWKEVRVGKVEQSFPEVASTSEAAVGPGVGAGFV